MYHYISLGSWSFKVSPEFGRFASMKRLAKVLLWSNFVSMRKNYKAEQFLLSLRHKCLPRLLAPDLPSYCCSLMVLDCTHPKYCSNLDPALVFLVTTSTMCHWVIFAPAAFLGSGGNVSGLLSEIKPWSFVIRQYLFSQEIPQTNW